MHTKLIIFAALAAVRAAEEPSCDRDCVNRNKDCIHYAPGGVEDAVCTQSSYQDKCPKLCDMCTPCEFLLTSDFEQKAVQLQSSVESMENQLSDIHSQVTTYFTTPS